MAKSSVKEEIISLLSEDEAVPRPRLSKLITQTSHIQSRVETSNYPASDAKIFVH